MQPEPKTSSRVRQRRCSTISGTHSAGLFESPRSRSPTVLTLALGIGGNVAVFSVVEAVLLRPLPYPAADRLVIVNHRDGRTGITKEFVPDGGLPGDGCAPARVRSHWRVRLQLGNCLR